MSITSRINYHASALNDPSALDIARAVADDVMAERDQERVREWIVTLALSAVRTQVNQSRASSVTAYRREVSRPGVSGRFARRQSAWARLLDERVLVGGVYKRQGDCTVADLSAAMADRREHVARVQWHVDRLAAFIAAMESHGVDTLGELPEGAVDQAALAPAA